MEDLVILDTQTIVNRYFLYVLNLRCFASFASLLKVFFEFSVVLAAKSKNFASFMTVIVSV